MDVQLNKTPELNDLDHSALYDYLRDVSIDSTFATSVLQVLIEERRTAHRDQWNTKRAATRFHVGDILRAYVQVPSNSATGSV